MQSTLEHAADGTLILTLTIPWAAIAETYKIVVDETVSQTEIAGFRKGKAPKDMVEERLDKNKIYEETIKRLIPKAYTEAVAEQKLAPIVMPQIELKSAEEEKDWVVTAKTCEKPAVRLGEYKKAVAALKSAAVPKIVVPGQEEPKAGEKKGPSVNEVLDAILKNVEVAIPELLIDHEVNHQLSELVDQTKRLGLTVEQYLASTGRTADSVRKEYAEQARNNLILEFALESIAEAEHVEVAEAEVDKVLASAKSPEERQNLENQRYYLTSLIRRQKTLDALMA